MTKEQWTALIVDYLSGGSAPADLLSRYHPLIIERYFDVVYSNVIYGVHSNAANYRDWGQFDNYLKAYKNVAVLNDTDRGEYYSLLPAAIIQLPQNRGIRLISPMKDQANKFWQIQNNEADIWSELEADKVVGNTQFYLEGDKVYYRNFYTDYITPGLLFKLLVPLSEFDDTDELGIPAVKSIEIFTMIVDMLRKKPPEKMDNSNTSKQV